MKIELDVDALSLNSLSRVCVIGILVAVSFSLEEDWIYCS